MSKLRRIVLVRHGETLGDSSTRFHGSADVALSDEGRAQMRAAGALLRTEVFDLVVASPLRRAWEAARIIAAGAPVRLEQDFREIDFGRWEGLTREEIETVDPVLHQQWQARAPGFEFPGGEPRAAFRSRVARGLAGIQAGAASAVLVVTHKGVIRTIAETLLATPLEEGEPELGARVELSVGPKRDWYRGRHGSNPPGLEDPAA